MAIKYLYIVRLLSVMEATAFSPSLYAFMAFLMTLFFGVTGYGMYISFGPPSKELEDPFANHHHHGDHGHHHH